PRLLLVIELRGLPTGRRVTGAALRAPFRVVHVIRRMAGDALSGCALVPIAEGTGVAGNVALLVAKRECRFVVTALRVAPCGHVVTGGAVASEPTFVRLFFPVAVHALRGCLAVWFASGMASRTDDVDVPAPQREIRPFMIELARAELDDIALAPEVL